MTSFEDWLAINHLLMSYAEMVDAGRFDDMAALFAHSTYRVELSGTDAVLEYSGSTDVLGFCQQTRTYEDGTPRTKHVVTNVDIRVEGASASASSYVTVFQQTGDFPLQPIASGRYLDRFDRVGGSWRFADRLITGFLLGDRSHHVTWHEDAPEGGAS